MNDEATTGTDEPIEATEDAGQDVKSDTMTDGGPGTSPREHRLAVILEGKDEGLSDDDIGAQLGIDGSSVRSIFEKHRRAEAERPHFFESSIAVKLEHHTPDDYDIEQIEKLRAAADVFAQQIDRIRKNPREVALAKTNLEQALMWGTKALALPYGSGD